MWGLDIENCDTIEVFKIKKYPEIWGFAWNRGLHALPTQSSNTFSVKSVLTLKTTD